jgi:hypothetical protein
MPGPSTRYRKAHEPSCAPFLSPNSLALNAETVGLKESLVLIIIVVVLITVRLLLPLHQRFPIVKPTLQTNMVWQFRRGTFHAKVWDKGSKSVV